MEEFNIYGWSALHEACYKGYSNAVIRFLDYARETEKNLIELRTIDDYQTTPIIIAALGGHMEVIDLLYKNGADINAELNYNKTKHGLIEIAAIKKDIELLIYLDDKIKDIPLRLRNLMISNHLDNQSRASLGRTIENLSQEYMSILKKLSKFRRETHEERLSTLFETKDIITYRTIGEESFGKCLAQFLKLNENNEDGIASCTMILLNVINDDLIRKNFIENKGIFYYISYMENHKKKLVKLIDLCKNIIKINSNKNQTFNWEDDDPATIKDCMKKFQDSLDDEENESLENSTWIECASIGQALNVLSKYEDCLLLINKDGSNEKIINYIKVLFDFNNFSRFAELSLDNETLISILAPNESNSLIFEQYIGPYLSCVANLAFKNQINKVYFLNMNLFEYILNFWKQIQLLDSSNNQKTKNANNNNNNKLQYFAPSSTFLSTSEFLNNYNFEQSSLFNVQKGTKSEDVDSFLNLFINEESASSKKNSFNKILLNITQHLIKNLKLIIIECLGKILYHNSDLKNKYIYQADFYFFTKPKESESTNKLLENSNWIQITINFIKKLLAHLETISYMDRDTQLEILRFLRLITDNDQEMQSRLINLKSLFNSNLINTFRNFLRKSSPQVLRLSAMFCLWSLTGDKNLYASYDRKCLIYRAIGAQKFVDALFDSEDEIILISLEAIFCISNSSPYRESDTNRLIHVQDDLAKVHAVQAVLRIMKSKNQMIIFSALKALSSMCVTTGYYNNLKNQTQLEKLGGFSLIIDLLNKVIFNSRLKCEAYFCLSMACLNNNENRKNLYKELDKNMDNFVIQLVKYLKTECIIIDYDEKTMQENLEILTTQISAGLSLCGFSFRNDYFKRKILLASGRINWYVFKHILNNLNKLENQQNILNSSEYTFEIERLKCLFGFQIAALHNLIIDADEDPRALGMKILVDSINNSKNTLLRSIACDYIGRLICFNEDLVEPFLSINTIEALSNSTLISDSETNNFNEKQSIGEAERGNASITLGFFTNMNPEARRILLKNARKDPRIMQSFNYFNQSVHIDLINQWNHFKELNDSIYKQINLSNLKNK